MSHWWSHQPVPDEPSRPLEPQAFNFYIENQAYKSEDGSERVRLEVPQSPMEIFSQSTCAHIPSLTHVSSY